MRLRLRFDLRVLSVGVVVRRCTTFFALRRQLFFRSCIRLVHFFCSCVFYQGAHKQIAFCNAVQYKMQREYERAESMASHVCIGVQHADILQFLKVSAYARISLLGDMAEHFVRNVALTVLPEQPIEQEFYDFPCARSAEAERKHHHYQHGRVYFVKVFYEIGIYAHYEDHKKISACAVRDLIIRSPQLEDVKYRPYHAGRQHYERIYEVLEKRESVLEQALRYKREPYGYCGVHAVCGAFVRVADSCIIDEHDK